ncbi:MAG TPA: hypothetical protein VF540_10100 [Segetibacter sp.]|jgi:hypothetical protein
MENNTSSFKRSSLSRENYGLAIYFFSAVLVIIGILSIIFGLNLQNLDWKNILVGFGLNVLAAVVFTLLYTFLANKRFMNVLKNDTLEIREEIGQELKNIESKINQGLNNISSNITTNTKSLQKKYMPILEFPASNEPDLNFNQSLLSDFKNSSKYYFKGAVGKHIPMRLKNFNRLEELRILMLNPCDNNSITLNAKIKKQTLKYKNKSLLEIEKEIREDIYRCIIALFDCNTTYPIHVAFENSTSVYRIELFDNSLYLSAYYEKAIVFYPETYKYDRNSFIYDIFRQDITRHFENSHKIEFKGNSDDDKLLNILKVDLECKTITIRDINRFREEYKMFIKNFNKELISSK